MEAQIAVIRTDLDAATKAAQVRDIRGVVQALDHALQVLSKLTTRARTQLEYKDWWSRSDGPLWR